MTDTQTATPSTPKQKKSRVPGLPYEAAIHASFKRDIDLLIEANPGASLTSLYGKFTAAYEPRVSPGMFRKFLKAIGYAYKRANVIERPSAPVQAASNV